MSWVAISNDHFNTAMKSISDIAWNMKISNRIEILKEQYRMGFISSTDYNRELNRLVNKIGIIN